MNSDAVIEFLVVAVIVLLTIGVVKSCDIGKLKCEFETVNKKAVCVCREGVGEDGRMTITNNDICEMEKR